MSNSCQFEQEGHCIAQLVYPGIERCKFDSIKEDEITGQCMAKESDLTKICEDCYEETDGCLCSKELETN